VVMLAVTNGVGKGSARSVPGVNIYECLNQCADLLVRFGGHAAAAGLTIKAEQIEPLRLNLEKVVSTALAGEEPVPSLPIDYELDFDAISDGLIDEIETLEPFGKGNPQPLFMSKNIQIISAKTIAVKHRRLTLKQIGSQNQKIIVAIHFNAGVDGVDTRSYERIAYRLQWNRYNGRKTPQLVIEAVE